MTSKFTTLLFAAGLASAASTIMERQDAAVRKLVIGAPFQLLTADFDGAKFSITGNSTTAGSAPSWILPRDPHLLYAVNENANEVNLYTLDENSANPTNTTTVLGAAGVVHLEYSSDKKRIVGAGYGSGLIDVWDSSATDGTLKRVKQINVTGPLGPDPQQVAHHPHQSLLDPTGRYFLIPDLGGDFVLVLDSQNDGFKYAGSVALPPASGPRHGGFISNGETHYYVLACELSNEVVLFQLAYPEEGKVTFQQLQVQSTYGTLAPANASSAAAGELIVANNNKDVYISNRLSGDETDSIAHFIFDAASATLKFSESISSGGILPRMFSLSKDEGQELAFVANQGGESGLVAFKRCADTGVLDPKPVATLANEQIGAPALAGTPNVGPQFVLEI